MGKIVILDTNVLLADPNSVLSFPRSEVVIPETVLSELDKLKTARVDADLRFRGREVSRILFDLSEEGSLIAGVDLPDGGRLRVAPFEPERDLPEGISSRNADDRILVTALHVKRHVDAETEVTLVTNDLNMLLKAQTLGITVQRYGNGVESGGFAKRFIIRPFQRYRVPLTILAVAVAVFVGVVVIAMYSEQNRTTTAIPAEFKNLLSTNQLAALDAINTLQSNPNDTEALLKMANITFDANRSALSADPGSAMNFGQQGIRYYERYLKVSPQDNDARSDLATLYFNTGQTDRAIQEVGIVLQHDKNHVRAIFNLGVFYAQGRRDYPSAEAQFARVIELTKNDSNQHAVLQQATQLLAQVQKLATGQSTTTTGAK